MTARQRGRGTTARRKLGGEGAGKNGGRQGGGVEARGGDAGGERKGGGGERAGSGRGAGGGGWLVSTRESRLLRDAQANERAPAQPGARRVPLYGEAARRALAHIAI